MEADYQRTKARYAKIFDDLNIALEDRVKALDLPVFKMVSTIEEESDRMINADFAEIASVIAKENTELSAQIGVAMSKKRAKEAIARATEFLRIHRQTDRAIQRSTISEAEARNGGIFLPVCFYETTEAGGVVNRDCSYDKEHLPQTVSSVVDNEILSNPDKVVSMHPVERENIEKYFNASIQQAMQQSTSPHDTRVINTINKLFYEK